MSVTIDIAFIKQYEAEVHEAYQRRGSRLRGMARTKNNITGMSTTFQKVGKGSAGTKTRHGLVPVMDVSHDNVECILVDYYAGDWVDKLDEYKTNINERQLLANAGAWALGRKTDELLIAAAATTTTTPVAASPLGNLTRKLSLEAIEYLNDNDVPDDGNRWCALPSHQWSAMMEIAEFTNSDYAGDKYPWLKGMEHRFWQNVTWVNYSGYPGKNTADMKFYMWHSSAIGHAIGAEVGTDITWHGDRAAHFIANSMSQGAVLIDPVGVVPIQVDDTTALT